MSNLSAIINSNITASLTPAITASVTSSPAASLSTAASANATTNIPLNVVAPHHSALPLPPASLPITDLTLLSRGLLYQTFFFALLFLPLAFTPHLILQLPYLALLFALTLILKPLLVLQHRFPLSNRASAVPIPAPATAATLFPLLPPATLTALLATKILARGLSHKNPRAILLVAWSLHSIVTVLTAFDSAHHHSLDIVVWYSFCADALITIAGIVLVRRWVVGWYKSRRLEAKRGGLWGDGDGDGERRARKVGKVQVRGLLGCGLGMYGITALPIAPIYTRVLYYDLAPSWIAYVGMLNLCVSLLTIAFCVPVACLFFKGAQWCCWHGRQRSRSQLGSQDSSTHSSGDDDTDEVVGEEKLSFRHRQKSRRSARTITSRRSRRMPGHVYGLGSGGGSLGDDGFGKRVSMSARYFQTNAADRDGRVSRWSGLGIGARGVKPPSTVYWTRLAAMHANQI